MSPDSTRLLRLEPTDPRPNFDCEDEETRLMYFDLITFRK